jgi:hypothetical protein
VQTTQVDGVNFMIKDKISMHPLGQGKGCVLFQFRGNKNKFSTWLKKERLNIDQKLEILSISSRGLKDVETGYSTIEMEFMAIALTL